MVGVTGISDIVSQSVLRVFNELNLASEAWFEKSKLLTLGRSNYAEYVANSLGQFPLFGTSRSASIEQAYVKVHITSELERERYKDVDEIRDALLRQAKGDKPREVASLDPIKALELTNTHFALLGNAGSGKTTAFRHIAVELAKGRMLRRRRRLPLYFSMRDMAPESLGVMEFGIRFLQSLGIGEAAKVLEKMLESGNLVLLLDGLDETDKSYQVRILRELNDFRSKYQKTIICISARPYSLAVAMPGFTKWETLPLDFNERLTFVEKWFEAVDPRKGKRLLEESKTRAELLDLGSSPLLLSVVCALYYNDLNIPSDPDELYAQAVEGLLGRWDAFRVIARNTPLSSLSVRRRVALVSWLAAPLFESGKIVFSARDLEELKCVKKAVRAMRMDAIEEDDLLTCLHNDFGLLVERAPGLYSFSHLTLHEYLVALYVVDHRRETGFLAAHRKEKQYFEILRLVAKMLPHAVEFMTALTVNFVRTSQPEEVDLLKAAWGVRPVCPQGIALQLLSALARHTFDLARGCSAHFRLVDECLVCEVPKNAEPMLGNLFAILNNSGFAYDEFKVGLLRELRIVGRVGNVVVSVTGERKWDWR